MIIIIIIIKKMVLFTVNCVNIFYEFLPPPPAAFAANRGSQNSLHEKLASRIQYLLKSLNFADRQTDRQSTTTTWMICLK